MMRWLPLILLVVFGVGIVLWARNANAVAVLMIEQGKVRLKRGKLSPSQRRDVQNAVRLSGVREGRVRVVAKGHAGVDFRLRPHDEGLQERLGEIVAAWNRD